MNGKMLRSRLINKLLSLFAVFAIIIGIVSPVTVSAFDGYVIDAYDIDIVVNEDNSYNITESITADFLVGKHGIIRSIPKRNKLYREDGSTSENLAFITDIDIKTDNGTGIFEKAKYRMYTEDEMLNFKIGSASKELTGDVRYIISYKYSIGKDPFDNIDELYFNIIGDHWDTSISNITFRITMPKDFDSSKLGFTYGTRYDSKTGVNYTVNGNVITGTFDYLASYEALTVRCELPEGYFRYNAFQFWLGIIGTLLAMMFFGSKLALAAWAVVAALWIYVIKLENEGHSKIIPVVTFYPPKDMNPLDIAKNWHGTVGVYDTTALIPYLAEKGYIKIKDLGKDKYILEKRKENDREDEAERLFLDGLFAEKDAVTKDDLYDKFYKTSEQIDDLYKERKTNRHQKLVPALLSFAACFVLIAGTVFLMSNPLAIIGVVIPFIIIIALTQKCVVYDDIVLAGEIAGFREFLIKAEKSQLEALVEEDPEYFYRILPYTYIFGISKKWIRKFESINMKAPDYYESADHSHFHPSVLDHTITSVSSDSVHGSTRSSSGGSGGSSGGGSSGGGSGGGGGSSW